MDSRSLDKLIRDLKKLEKILESTQKKLEESYNGAKKHKAGQDTSGDSK